jgi:hypothetical protein
VKGATPSGCISCHGNTKDATYEKWKVAVKTMQMDADEAYEKANKLFETAKDLDAETSKKASALLKGIQADFQLVKRGNAVHNVTYSMDLLDSVTSRCQQVITSINKAKKNNAAKSTEPAKK